jgi:hypothetical protein
MATQAFTQIANASVLTPASGVTHEFVDTDGKLKIKKPTTGVVETLLNMSSQTIVTATGTTSLNNTSPIVTVFTGTAIQTCKLPDATTIQAGQLYKIRNNSTLAVTLQDGNAGALIVLSANTTAYCCLITAGTIAGVWNIDSIGFFADNTDSTKKLLFSESGATTGTNLTVAEAQTTSQTLNVPNIASSSIIITDTLAQNITGVKTMTNMTALTNTNAVPAQTIPAGGVVLSAAAAGAVETDGACLYYTHNTTDGRAIKDLSRFFRLTGAGGAITTIADYFGANSAIDMPANSVYEIEWHCWTIQNTGAATNWTWTITLSGAVTRAQAFYECNAIAGMGAAAAMLGAGVISFTTTQALPVTGSMAAANHYTLVRAVVDCGATPRNVRLRLTVAANNATAQAGSWFRARRVSAGNTGAFAA